METKPFDTVVLARARGGAEVAEMRRWRVTDLFAAAEKGVEALPGLAGLRHVRNRIIDSLREGQGAPCFLAEGENGESVGIYVLCISNPASYGALTQQQFDWCRRHEGLAIYALPCAVQQLAEDYARCVAQAPICLRNAAGWQDAAEESRSLLPPHVEGLRPYEAALGTAAPLKRLNLLREAVNRGSALYPRIDGLPGRQALPPGFLLKGIGTEPPLMLALSEGLRGGKVQLLYGDFYSWENPVNELEVSGLPQGNLLTGLLDSCGTEYCAIVAEAAMFPGLFRNGMHFRWSVSLLADSFELRGEGESAYSFLQEAGTARSTLVGRIETLRQASFCGVPAYCLQSRIEDAPEGPVFNVYVLPTALGEGMELRVGDLFGCSGMLYAAPDAYVETDACWADSPVAAACAWKQEQMRLPDEGAAAHLFKEMMERQSFVGIAPLLKGDVRYLSETTPIALVGRAEMLKHLGKCFREWQGRSLVPMLEFHCGTIGLEGARRPCVIAAFRKKVFSATVFQVENGLIVAIRTLAGRPLLSLKLAQTNAAESG